MKSSPASAVSRIAMRHWVAHPPPKRRVTSLSRAAVSDCRVGPRRRQSRPGLHAAQRGGLHARPVPEQGPRAGAVGRRRRLFRDLARAAGRLRRHRDRPARCAGRRRNPRFLRLPAERAVRHHHRQPALRPFSGCCGRHQKTAQIRTFRRAQQPVPVFHRKEHPPPEAGRRTGVHRAARVHQADRRQEAERLALSNRAASRISTRPATPAFSASTRRTAPSSASKRAAWTARWPTAGASSRSTAS